MNGRLGAAYSLLYGACMLVTILVIFIVFFDQITKHFASLCLQGGQTVTLIPRVISLRYHENSGAAWGILSDKRWVFMIISTIAILAIIAFMIYTRKQAQSKLLTVSLSFFLGGGIGNMIDRIRLEYVIDFLRFDFIEFPIFNVADSFITIGAGLMMLYLILETIKEEKAKRNLKKEHENV